MTRWEFDIPDDAKEEWRIIPSFPVYQVSDYGRVRRTKSKRMLTQRLSAQGFPQVTLSMNNRVQVKYVHTLVAEAFHGYAPLEHFVQHVDGDKANNTPENLRYVLGYAYSGRAANLGPQASHVVEHRVPCGWYIYRNTQLLHYFLPVPDVVDQVFLALEKEVDSVKEGDVVWNGTVEPAVHYVNGELIAVYYAIYVPEAKND